MKITLSWIQSYVPELNVSAQEFVDRMTMSGIKVTGYERTDRNLEKIVIGQIVSCEHHPDAENLMVCQVNTGEEVIQCITSASNIKAGDKVPVALEGGKVEMIHDSRAKGRDGARINKEVIRGMESQGVLCSVEELGFTREQVSDAPAYEIFVLDEDAEVGADAIKTLGLSDIIFNFEPASARKDCYRVLGIAREAAAIFGHKFVAPSVEIKTNGEKIEDYLTVKVKDGVLCPRYCARVVKNVQLGPSPRWMQQRLISCGIRPVNNLVDITNYVMEEYGQPILAFDLDSLSGHEIRLEKSEDGNKFRTLDGQLRNVDSQTLMLCDSLMPIGIAGIIGGASTKVEESGRTIVLEAACFDGAYIRKISRKLNLTTEISSRFARGLDANYAEEGLNRACQLMEELGCGEVVGGMIDECSTVVGSRRIEFHPDWINHHLGTNIPEEDMIHYLESLGFEYDKTSHDMITPAGRQDILEEADMMGEVVRLYGYDKVPTTIPRVETTRGSLPLKMQIENIARNLAEFYGYSQIMTYSFESPEVFDRLRIPENSSLRRAIRIQNPLSESYSIMRTQSVGSMMNALSLNAERKHRHVRFYELANIYLPRDLERNELPDERMQFTLGTYGGDDFFTVKGIMEEFLRQTGLRGELIYDPENRKPYLHPGRQAALVYEGTVIGYMGEVHPRISESYNISDRVTIAVIDMPEIVLRADFSYSYHGVNLHAKVCRDLSILLDEKTRVGSVEAVIRKHGGNFLEHFEMVGKIYRGQPLPEQTKSVTYRLRFQAQDHDLTGEEVQAVLDEIQTELRNQGISRTRE
ncbi:MAG: phenylalanine--tRNA ligase subunit beta [Clostridiales bacterium]|nr:phenylalanine--tRNA ligase subunit beta [Clostridiales bacterium]